jgi:hypothetical protein
MASTGAVEESIEVQGGLRETSRVGRHSRGCDIWKGGYHISRPERARREGADGTVGS